MTACVRWWQVMIGSRRNELVVQKNCDEVGHARVRTGPDDSAGGFNPNTVMHHYYRNPQYIIHIIHATF